MASGTCGQRRCAALFPGALILAFICTGSAAFARTAGSPPAGLTVGRWVIAPYLLTNAGVDSNLFRASECSGDEEFCPRREGFVSNTLGIVARLPVRNSLVELRYQADKREYSNFQPRRPIEQTVGALVQFNFGSGDAFTVSDTYSKGASDVTSIDEGGEFVFRDQPFNLNRLDLTWRRINPSRQGFIVRVTRADLNFDGVDPDSGVNERIPFFDYRGFETAFEFRQPVAGGNWLRVYYDSRRFNHYNPNEPDQIGIPFRKEEADTLQVGMGGLLGSDKPFDVRLGYGRFRLVGQDARFDGMVGAANFALRVGGRTSVGFSLVRRPLPSSFPTYYIINTLRITAERPFLREFQVGLALDLASNQYGDILFEGETEIRKDQRYAVEAYFDWVLHPRFAIRVAAGHQRRESNFDGAEFTATAASIGFRLGWF